MWVSLVISDRNRSYPAAHRCFSSISAELLIRIDVTSCVIGFADPEGCGRLGPCTFHTFIHPREGEMKLASPALSVLSFFLLAQVALLVLVPVERTDAQVVNEPGYALSTYASGL